MYFFYMVREISVTEVTGFTWEVVLVLPEHPRGFTWEVVLVLPEPPVAAWCGPWSAPQGHSGPCDFSPGESQ